MTRLFHIDLRMDSFGLAHKLFIVYRNASERARDRKIESKQSESESITNASKIEYLNWLTQNRSIYEDDLSIAAIACINHMSLFC